MADEPVWPCLPSAYELGALISDSASATVYRAQCVEPGPFSGADVAVKRIKLEMLTTSLASVYSEVKTMRMCRSDNVLCLCASFLVDSELWLITPLMDKGSVLSVMQTLKSLGAIPDNGGLPEDVIAAIIRQTLVGLEYLHTHGHIHRDIKASNLLVDAEGCLRIADFGVAGWMDDITARDGKRETLVGTPCWMAPEVMHADRAGGYDSKADIWSVGITAMELAKGTPPYAHLTAMEVLVRTMSRAPPTFDSYPESTGRPKFSSQFTSFLQECLVKDPAERKSASELLGHKFVKSGKQSALVALLTRVPTGASLLPRSEYQEWRRVGEGVISESTCDLSMSTPLPSQVSPVIAHAATTQSATYTPNTTWFFPDTSVDESEAVRDTAIDAARREAAYISGNESELEDME